MKLTSERVTTKVLPAHVTGNGVALSKKRWLVAQVRIYHEKKTSEKIFVRVDAQEQKDVLMLSAVSRYMVLHGESAPAVIPDTQMEKFKFMLDYSEEAVNMSNAPLSPGEKVRVIKGPLRGLEGELVTLNGKTKIAVRLDMLGCASVDMPVGYIERVV